MTAPRAAGPRFVLVGSVLADVAVAVPEPPAAGADTLAGPVSVAAAGGFNVLAAARRQGMRALYAGRVGTGPFGDHVAAALRDEGVATLLPRTAGADTGICIVMVDGAGERTMVTSAGIEAHLAPGELDGLTLEPDDLVYLSGYDLAFPHGPGLVAWLTHALAGRPLIVDPGPLVAEIPPALLDPVLARCTWLSLNATEARVIGGREDLADAARRLWERGGALRGVIVRDGPAGCLLVDGSGVTAVPGVPVTAIDSTGAGDCHVGVFAAAIARGVAPAQACAVANAAAAIAVTRRGPATAPTRTEVGAY